MLIVNNTYTDPYFNLAAEEFFLKNFQEDIFMLWQNEPSVIIGKHQNVQAEVNTTFIREKNIKIARRFSGGGAVYNDLGNLNLTFIENNGDSRFGRFADRISRFLNTTGLHPQCDERYSLTLHGLKISGSAQYMYKNTVLFHASLLFSTDLAALVKALNNESVPLKNRRKIYVESVKSPVTNVKEHLPYSMQTDEFKQLIIDHFIRENQHNSLYTLLSEDITAINRLKKEKYGTPGWNLNASTQTSDTSINLKIKNHVYI